MLGAVRFRGDMTMVVSRTMVPQLPQRRQAFWRFGGSEDQAIAGPRGLRGLEEQEIPNMSNPPHQNGDFSIVQFFQSNGLANK
jgi:hypothetical protein